MIVLRCFRPDRVLFAVRNYVTYYMKSQEFIQSKPTSIGDIYDESEAKTPIIFVPSPGVDPTESLLRKAEELGMEVNTISLGKG